MFELLFLILFVLFPFLIFFLYKNLLKESFLKVGLLNFLLINIFVFAYIGIVFLFFHMDSLRVDNGVVDRGIIFNVWLFSATSTLFVVFGAFFSKRALLIKDVFFDPSKIKKNTVVQKYKAYIFILIGLVALFLYIREVQDVAIFNIFSLDNKSDLGKLRSDMGSSFQGSYFLYSLFMKDVLQFLLFSFYGQWLVFKTKKELYVVIFLFFVNSFTALMAVEKAPIVWLIVGMFLVNLLITKNGLYPFKSIFKMSVPVLCVLIFGYMFFMGDSSISNAFNSILSRTFTGSITPAYFYLDFFPKYYDYLYGASFPNPLGIFPYTPVQLTVLVMDTFNPELARLGIVGTMPTVFWAEIYANFGALLIMPVSFLVGFALKLFDGIVLRFREHPMWVGYYVWVILYFKNLSVTSFSNFVLNISLILVTFIFIFISTKSFRLSYIR